MTLQDIEGIFPTEAAVLDHIIRALHGARPACRHCGSDRVYRRRENAKVFDCNACGNTFSPFAGTLLAKSASDLRKWACAAAMLTDKRGVTGVRLMQEVGVTYKTAWRMLKQLRAAQADAGQQALLAALAAAGAPGSRPAAQEAAGPGGESAAGRIDLSVPHARVHSRGW